MEDRDVFILEEIVDYCDKVASTLDKIGGKYENFKEDSDYQDICAFRTMQIGELVNSLSDRFKGNHPEIEWRNIIAFRNIVTHDYGKIDVKKMWDTVIDDVPALKEFCEKQIR
ncbi:DUF86 domain-containing protein [Candidatus Saccharibacteria bacterium]|nr:DUF86 domain-containing protein [Candidatus Saccharibacteria bacterium]